MLPEEKRLHLLGNTWHVPSFKLFFAGLAWFCGLPPAKGVPIVRPSHNLAVPVSVTDPVPFLWGKTGPDFVQAYIMCQPPPLSNLAMPDRELFDAPLMVNGFLQEQAVKGLYEGGVVLADFYEQCAAGGFAAAASCQRGSSFSEQGWPRLVPEGLGAAGHLRHAQAT